MRGLNRKLALAVMMLAIGPMALAQDRSPSGTLAFSGGAIAVGFGYSWGEGTLDFKGKKYPFSMDGLSIVDVGVASIEGSGEVYNMTSPQQLAGNYVAAGVGVTIAGGGSVVALQNQNGVVIHVHTTQEGLKFNLSASGVSIRMKSSS
jgi:hypothetical protein